MAQLFLLLLFKLGFLEGAMSWKETALTWASKWLMPAAVPVAIRDVLAFCLSKRK